MPGVDRGLHALVVELGRATAPAARSTVTSVPSPEPSSRIVHSSAGRTWSGSSDAAPSESDFGCSGTFESAP